MNLYNEQQNEKFTETSFLKEYLLLQVNDALFPIGGYSHSFGLETYIQKEIVRDIDSAYDYICKWLLYSFAYSDLLSVKLAYEAAGKTDFVYLDELEEIMKASRIPIELRTAAHKLGSRFVKTLLQTQVVHDDMILSQHVAMREHDTICHSCAYGIFCFDIHVSLEAAMSHYLYAQASALVTNCVKSIPLSQSAGQKLLASLHPVFAKTMEKARQCGKEMLCLSTPGFDVRSIQHETLYSRIYMS